MGNNKTGWGVKTSGIKNEYIVFFNGIRVAVLCDSLYSRGSLPQMIIIPEKKIPTLSVSVMNDADLCQDGCISHRYTTFDTPPEKE